MVKSFPKNIDSLPDVYLFIQDCLSGRRVAQEILFQIELAVEEVFVNAVKHNMGSGEDVEISLNIDDNILRIRLIDKNVERFDPESARKVDITQPIHKRTPGGLGIHLINSILDDVQYSWHNGTSTITLIKDLGN